jgi:hypothetical protein
MKEKKGGVTAAVKMKKNKGRDRVERDENEVCNNNGAGDINSMLLELIGRE